MPDQAIELFIAVLPTVDGMAQALLKKGHRRRAHSVKRSGQGNGVSAHDCRSNDPKIWNIDSTQKAQSYALPISGVPATINRLRVNRANAASALIPIMKNMPDMYSRTAGYGVQGSKAEQNLAVHLGSVDEVINSRSQQAQISLVESNKDLQARCCGWFVIGQPGHLLRCESDSGPPAGNRSLEPRDTAQRRISFSRINAIPFFRTAKQYLGAATT